MAWISKREEIPKGKRQWQLGWRDASGRRSFEYFATKKEAEKRRDELGYRQSRGERFEKTSKTFGEFAEEWFERIAKQKKAASQRAWASYLKTHLLPYFGERKIQEIVHADIEDFARRKRRDGLSRTTVSHLVNLMHLIFRDAKKRNLLLYNPASRVEIPTVAEDHKISDKKKRNSEILKTEEQIARFVAAAQGMYPARKCWGALLTLAVYSGLREGEILGLEWRDLDLDAKQPRLRVRQSWDRIEGLQTPKSEAARRSVPILPEVKKALLEWKMATKENGAKSRVFPVASGSARDALREIINGLKENDADFPRPSLHALRRTYASTLACRGIAPKLLQAWMGHSSIAMTLEIYAKVMPDAEERVIEEKLAGFGGV